MGKRGPKPGYRRKLKRRVKVADAIIKDDTAGVIFTPLAKVKVKQLFRLVEQGAVIIHRHPLEDA